MPAAPLFGQSTKADEMEIREGRQSSNKAIEAHDTVGISKHWCPNIIVVTSRNAQYSGRRQNAMAFASEFKSKEGLIYVRTPDKVQVNANAGMAAESGTWVGRWKNGDEKISVTGSYYAKWIKTSGHWFIRAETYTLLKCEGDSYCKTF
jgi:ketosteroid isomerase-like protein